jgi:ribonucleoside-diphosphate reductase alpha chain
MQLSEGTAVVEPVETKGDVDNRPDELETKDTHGTEDREVPAKVTQGEAHTSAELLEKITGTAVDSPLCMTCGTKMRPAGSCYVCEGCGSTSGCS